MSLFSTPNASVITDVMLYQSSAVDVLRLKFLSRALSQLVDEVVAGTWLQARGDGGPSCTSKQPWLASLQRRARLEAGCLLPALKLKIGHQDDETERTALHALHGFLLVGDSRGGVEVMDPYSKYKWQAGADHFVGRLSDLAFGNSMRGDVIGFSVAQGEDKLIVAWTPKDIVVFDVSGHYDPHEGICGGVRARMQARRDAWSGKRPSGTRELPEVGGTALPRRAGPGECISVISLKAVDGSLLFLGAFSDFIPELTLNLWQMPPEPSNASAVQRRTDRVISEHGISKAELMFRFDLIQEIIEFPDLVATQKLPWNVQSMASLTNSSCIVSTHEGMLHVLKCETRLSSSALSGIEGSFQLIATISPEEQAEQEVHIHKCGLAVMRDMVVYGGAHSETLSVWNVYVPDTPKRHASVSMGMTCHFITVTSGLALVGNGQCSLAIVDVHAGAFLRKVTFSSGVVQSLCVTSRYIVCLTRGARIRGTDQKLRFFDIGINVEADLSREHALKAKESARKKRVEEKLQYLRELREMPAYDEGECDASNEEEEEEEVEEDDEVVEEANSAQHEPAGASFRGTGHNSELSGGEEHLFSSDSEYNTPSDSENPSADSSDIDMPKLVLETLVFPEAEYIDESLACTTLLDHGEVVIGKEIWCVKTRKYIATMPADCEKFAVLGGDKKLVLGLLGYTATAVKLISLPSCQPVASLDLPVPKEDIGFLSALTRVIPAADRPEALLLSKSMLFFINVDTEALSLKLVSCSRFDALLGNEHSVISAAALWHQDNKPVAGLAMCCKAGSVAIVDLHGAPTFRQTIKGLKGKKFNSNEPYIGVMRMKVHLRASSPVLVLCSALGKVSIIDLETLRTVREWRVVKGGPCHVIATHRHVLFTASQFENRGTFWNIDNGQVLKVEKPLGQEMRRGKFTIMKASFTESGCLAFTNSNDCDDPVLKLLRNPDGW